MTNFSLVSSGKYNSALPTYTSGQTAQFQTDVNGRLIVSASGSTFVGEMEGQHLTTQPTLGNGDLSPIQLTARGATIVGVGTEGFTVTANAGTGTFTVADANLELAQGSTTSGQVGPLIQGAVTTAAPTYTTGKTNPLSLTTAGALRTDSSATTQPISGTVTANAGTNLNTSLLALESGGNLATIAGVVTSARAAVNPISGQAGVQGGSGAVSALTQRVVLATDVALPTGTNPLGSIASVLSSSALYNGTTALTPQFAKIDISASGDNTIIAGVSAKSIYVLSYTLIAAGTVTAQWFSDVGGSEVSLSGAMSLTTYSGASPAFCSVGLLQTASGKALNLKLGGNTQVSGHLTYVAF